MQGALESGGKSGAGVAAKHCGGHVQVQNESAVDAGLIENGAVEQRPEEPAEVQHGCAVQIEGIGREVIGLCAGFFGGASALEDGQ
jgi:hypothetical protein